MKIAAGCFGCLTFLLLGLVVVFNVMMGPLISGLAGVDPDLATAFGSFSGMVTWVADGCCCLSGALSVILFAVGMSRGNNEAVE